MIGRSIGMLAIGLGVALSACADAPLTIMTFNLRYGSAPDGENAWAHRKGILTEAIKQCAPDVFGTQECLEPQAEFIAETLPEYRWIGLGREANAKGEMSAIFYKKDVLSPIESGNFWVSETPEVPGSKSWNTSCTRMVTWVHFRHLSSNTFFYHFNTHLDHKSEEARQQGAKLLLQRATAMAGEHAAIITGDFNAFAGDAEAWRILTQGGFADAWVAAEKKAGPELTFGNFAAPQEGAKGRIDWILTKGPVKAMECETVLYNDKGHYPSDHYPVVAKLLLTP